MKRITVRKAHQCDACEEMIAVGTICLFEKGRYPTFEKGSDKQTGIEYYAFWVHEHCILVPRCVDGCQYEPEYEFDHYAGYNKVFAPTNRELCRDCGNFKPDEK